MQTAVQRRPTLLLIVALSILMAMMSASARTRLPGGKHTLLERTLLWAVSPIPRTVHWVSEHISDIYYGYIDMRADVRENVSLRREVDRLTRENYALEGTRQDTARLRSLLAHGEQLESPTTLAEILMIDTASSFKSMILDRGSSHGVEINDAVVTPSGLIGRVVLTTKDVSKVQMILDSNAAVGCQLERSRRQGLVRGNGTSILTLDLIPALADVELGDHLVTSGTDGIYPHGLHLGTVISIEEGNDLFKIISCEPAVDFSSIEEVLILHTNKIPEEVVRYEP